ncbi:hypothetical protein MIR68_001334 [Amoeboaphelidium protococcarum]|nr:hypothetical protein MIR68_001334 [Amoeboaphelidium protococcarum]
MKHARDDKVVQQEDDDHYDIDQIISEMHETERQRKTQSGSNTVKRVSLNKRKNLEDGLITKLDESNKGFKLLQKLGYQKNQDTNEQIDQISELQLQASTSAGKRTQMEERPQYASSSKRQMPRKQDASQSVEMVRQRAQAQARLKTLQKFVDQAQQVFETFNNKDETAYQVLDDDDEDTVSIEQLESRLKVITEQLRTRYFYCIYCGCAFDNMDDMNQNCPGDSFEDH